MSKQVDQDKILLLRVNLHTAFLQSMKQKQSNLGHTFRKKFYKNEFLTDNGRLNNCRRWKAKSLLSLVVSLPLRYLSTSPRSLTTNFK